MDDLQKASEVQKAALDDLRAIWIRLTTDAQKARRNLLLSSAIGMLIAITGATPKKIETFGMELDASHDVLFYAFVILAISYFLWSFIHYNERDLNMHSRKRTGDQIKKMLGPYYDVYLNYLFFYGTKSNFRPYWLYLPCIVTAISICAIIIRIGFLLFGSNASDSVENLGSFDGFGLSFPSSV